MMAMVMAMAMVMMWLPGGAQAAEASRRAESVIGQRVQPDMPRQAGGSATRCSGRQELPKTLTLQRRVCITAHPTL